MVPTGWCAGHAYLLGREHSCDDHTVTGCAAGLEGEKKVGSGNAPGIDKETERCTGTGCVV
eukprot:1158129-Pelagomonas_calceolata.AAC.2